MMTLGGQSFTNAYYQLFLADQKAYPSGVTPTIAAQPFFETALGGPTSNFCKGYPNCSSALLAWEGFNGYGDLATGYGPWSLVQDIDLNAYGTASTTPSIWNFGSCNGCQMLPSSVGHYEYNNNQAAVGLANYQAMFLTLQKRAGHGLVVSANYTYSKTLNTIGLNQEYTNYTSNYVWNPHFDFAPAIFDRTQVINALASYQLPFGKGKYFSTKNPVLDRIIGGWTFSPVYTWGTGLVIETDTGSGQEFGGSGYTGWDTGMVPLVSTGSFGHSAQINYHASSTTASYVGPSQGSLVGTANDPYPDCGGNVCAPHTLGLNLFKNPAAVFNSYRPDLLGLDTYGYDMGPYYGQHRWNVDFTLAKQTYIKEKWNITFYAQFLNAFNHVEFGDPGMNYEGPTSFGDITGQYNGPRVVELGLRLYF
jgi:hypothetical protein